MEVKRALTEYAESFIKVSDSPDIDAECLVMHITGLSRAELFTHPETVLTDKQENDLRELTKRRLNGEPIAYLTGHKEFWNLDLKVTPDVLIPRPETECLVECLLDHYSNEQHLKVADLGVGSGAIALALANERPAWKIHATDNSKNALHVAKENAQKHHLHNIHFFEGEWCEALPDHNYDIVVSNPPYIASGDHHLRKLQFEPIEALDAGKEGLDAIHMIVHQAKDYLKKGGILILEHGYDQRDAVLGALKMAGYDNPENHLDLAGQPRFSLAVTLP